MGTEYLGDLNNASNMVGDYLTQQVNNAKDSVNLVGSVAADTIGTFLNSAIGLGQKVRSMILPDAITNWMPSTDENPIDTQKVLSTLSTGMGNYYQDHEDLVKGLSFVAGTIGAAGTALKGINALRAGVADAGYLESSGFFDGLAKGAVNIFSGTKKTKLVAEAEQIFAESGAASKEYASLKRALYAEAAVNFTIDNAAAELAVVGTMNAHPYMEDYMDDFGSSFVKSMAFGTLFTPLAMPAVWRTVKNLEAPIETTARELVTKELLPYSKQFGYANAANFQIAEENRKWLTPLTIDPLLPRLVKDMAESELKQVDIFQGQALEAMYPGWAKLANPELKDSIRNLILQDNFGQIERLNPVKFKFGGKPSLGTAEAIDEEKAIEILGQAPEKGQPKVFYRPGEDTWFSKDGIVNIGRAVDLKNVKLAPYAVRLGDTVMDFDLQTLSRAIPSAESDLRFLNELKALSGQKSDDLAKYAVSSESDLPRLNALVSWISQHPRLSEDLKFKVLNETGETRLVDAKDILDLYTKETETMINQMAQTPGKFSFDEIASRLNVTKAAAMMTATGKPLKEIPDWRRYSNSALIDSEYLNEKNALLAASSNKFRNPLPELISNLDQQSFQAAHLDFMESLVLQHNNSIANKVFANFQGKEMVNIVQGIRSKVQDVNNALVGNPRWQSADNALRRLTGRGDMMGEVLTYIGKRIVDTKDAIIKDLLEPLARNFTEFKPGSTLLAEYNNAHNIALGIKGYKQLVTNPENGYAFFVRGKVPLDAKLGELLDKAVQKDGGIFYIKQPEVITALQASQTTARELFGMHNVLREFRGLKPLEDTGFYLPPPSLINKHYSYVVDKTGKQQVQTLIADSANELKSLEEAFLSANPEGFNIVNRKDQVAFNKISGYADGSPYVNQPNIAMQHGGSSKAAIVPSDASYINDLMSGFEYQISAATRKFNELYLHDITNSLDRLSEFYQAGQSKQALFSATAKSTFGAKDSALFVKNLLLGQDSKALSTTWKTLDDNFDLGLNLGNHYINVTIEGAQKLFGSKDTQTVVKGFDQLAAKLDELGISNPWKTFGEYYASQGQGPKNLSRRIISTGQSLAATLMLRLFDAGFILANTLSVPIMGTSAILQSMERTPIPGIDPNKFQLLKPMKLLMDGVAHIFSPEGKRMQEIWEKEGHLDQAVRQWAETTGALQAAQISTTPTGKLLDKIDAFTNSKTMGLLTRPADFTENLTRQMAMHTGYTIAKKAYPGIGDKGATILAVSYADRAIGNYYAHQRPIVFQGTLGAAVSLYQTYMLTFAQSIFRDLEAGAFKRLGTTFLLQAGIFGLNGLPGYNALSEFIGQNYSKQHTDLNTGAYKSVGDTAADLMLYGLPSNILFDSALYVRGDVTPRVPSLQNSMALYSTLVSGYQAVAHGVSAFSNAQGWDKLRALGESVSLQTINRPLARWAEIGLGNSITRQGNTVQTPAEVWTPTGVFSRLLALRPISEQKIRTATHLQSAYGTADNQNRQEAIDALQTSIRGGSFNEGTMEDVAAKYIRNGGSAQGFRAAINHVMLSTTTGARADLMRKLEADSAVRRLIDDNF